MKEIRRNITEHSHVQYNLNSMGLFVLTWFAREKCMFLFLHESLITFMKSRNSEPQRQCDSIKNGKH